MSRNKVAQRADGWLPVNIGMRVEASSYPSPDPLDSVITVPTEIMALPLMTNDAAINASQLADIYW